MVVENLKQLLNEGIVEFTFKKVNGDIRNVKATRCLHEDIVGKDFQLPSSSIDTPGIIRFVDLNKMEWRSCKEELVQTIDKVYTQEEMFTKKD